MAQQFNANVNIAGTLTSAGLATLDGGADLSAEQIINLAAGSASGHAVEYDQMNSAITSALTGALEYKGTFDAGTTALTAPANEIGDFYLISGAGTAYGTEFAVGDHLVFSADVNAAVAPTSSDFDKIDNTEAGSSLLGLTDTDLTGAAAGDILMKTSSGDWEDADLSAEFTVVSTSGSAAISINSIDADKIDDSSSTNKFTSAADISKLAGIESGATADQTGAEIKAAYEAEANAFTDAQFTKLAGIEASAKDDQDASEVPYTPAVLADWDGAADPGEVDDALDQLAERVKDNEEAIALGSDDQTASEVNYTQSTPADWTVADGSSVKATLDEAGSRISANDAKVSADGLVTTHSDITDAGSGAIITVGERALVASALQAADLKRYSALIGNGALTTIPVNHALDLTSFNAVQISMFDVSTGEQVFPDSYTFTDKDNLSAVFINAPSASGIRINIVACE